MSIAATGGRAAWTGARLARDTGWALPLPAAATAGIEAALATLRDPAPPRVDSRRFPLPRSAPFLAEVEHGHGLLRRTGLDPSR